MPEADPLPRPKIALVSRELAPFGGGGIGQYVTATARLLSDVADVIVLTSNAHARAYADLAATSERPFGSARVAFVPAPAPGEKAGHFSEHHLYSARVLERLRELYPDQGPDLIEFSDFLAEGAVTIQARKTLDPFLLRTTIAVRLHVSAEMCLVSDGYLPDDEGTAATLELERMALRDADVLLATTDAVRDGYEQFYVDEPLAPFAHVPYTPIFPLDTKAGDAPSGPLRLLHIGRLERRKNVHELVSALTAIRGDWHLTILGTDTDTGPLGTSVEEQLRQQIAADERFEILQRPLPLSAIDDLIRGHDIVLSSAPFETGPFTALHALAVGVPILGVPGGGLADILVPGVTGWRATSPRSPHLRAALEPLIEDPKTARALRGSAALLTHARRIFDTQTIKRAFVEDLPRRSTLPSPPPRPARSPASLVTVVVPYFRLHQHIEETIVSVLNQTYDRVELIVVNDGSFEPEDQVLKRLAVRYPMSIITQPNQGLGSARNTGIRQARGRYVLPLDADNLLEPTFIERCVQVLDADQDAAYATSWNRYVEEDGQPRVGHDTGYRPFTNRCALVERINTAGDAVAVIRWSVFDRHRQRYDPLLTSYEDWSFYRRLRRAGLYGRVVPEALVRYRVRESSMLRSIGVPYAERLAGELRAADHQQGSPWT